MIFNCPAKINLFLKVKGKRPDGYHEIESLFAFLDLFDLLEVKKNNKFKIEIDGEFAKEVDLKNNILTKILNFFCENFHCNKNLYIKLTKNIPVGAGLGGGSSNAAYFMMALNQIFSLELSKKELQKISFNFGSDIAFFFEGKASIVKGRGEIFEEFPNFERIPTLLVNPKINLSTKEVFDKLIIANSYIKSEYSEYKDALLAIKNIENDLEKPAISIEPIINEILEELRSYDAIKAKMSGSGSSCFAIFKDETDLKNSYKKLSQKFNKFLIKKSFISYNLEPKKL